MNILKTLQDMWSWQALIEIPMFAVIISVVLRFIEGTRVAGILKE